MSCRKRIFGYLLCGALFGCAPSTGGAGGVGGAGDTEIWTRQFGSTNDDEARSVSRDSSGNVLVAGESRSALLGQTPSVVAEAFVRKLDAGGDELWARQVGANSNDVAVSVSADSSGNVLVTGYTEGALPGQTSSGSADALVRKFDADGNELWTRQFGTSGNDLAQSVSVDSSGNVLVAGHSSRALPEQTSSGAQDAFVRKFDADGKELWTRQFGSTNFDGAYSVSVDSSGNVLVAGYTDGAFQTSLGGHDAFVRKFDAAGNVLWTRQFGTSGQDEAHSVSVDSSGSVLVAGFTSGVFSGQTSSGFQDAFVRKFDSEGTEVWTRQFGSNNSDFANSVSVDSSGNVLVAGYTDGAFQASLGGRDAFVRKFNAAGNVLWTRQFGTSGNDLARSVSVDSSGDILVAGSTTGRLPGQTLLGGSDAFVMRWRL